MVCLQNQLHLLLMGFILIFHFYNSLTLLPVAPMPLRCFLPLNRTKPTKWLTAMSSWGGAGGQRKALFYSELWHSPFLRPEDCPRSFYKPRTSQSNQWLFCGQTPHRVKDNRNCPLPPIFLYFSSPWIASVTFLSLYLPVVWFVCTSGVFSWLSAGKGQDVWSMT